MALVAPRFPIIENCLPLLIDTDYGDLTKIIVSFTIYKSSDLTYSNPIATVPSVASVLVISSGMGLGTAKATINNLPVDDYTIIARIASNDYYKPITSTPTPLTVYEPLVGLHPEEAGFGIQQKAMATLVSQLNTTSKEVSKATLYMYIVRMDLITLRKVILG